MIKAEFIGREVLITTLDGLKYVGKVVEVNGPDDSEYNECEIGINFAGGIRMFRECEINSISIVKG